MFAVAMAKIPCQRNPDRDFLHCLKYLSRTKILAPRILRILSRSASQNLATLFPWHGLPPPVSLIQVRANNHVAPSARMWDVPPYYQSATTPPRRGRGVTIVSGQDKSFSKILQSTVLLHCFSANLLFDSPVLVLRRFSEL